MKLYKVTRTVYISADDMLEEGDAYSDYFCGADFPMMKPENALVRELVDSKDVGPEAPDAHEFFLEQFPEEED